MIIITIVVAFVSILIRAALLKIIHKSSSHKFQRGYDIAWNVSLWYMIGAIVIIVVVAADTALEFGEGFKEVVADIMKTILVLYGMFLIWGIVLMGKGVNKR